MKTSNKMIVAITKSALTDNILTHFACQMDFEVDRFWKNDENNLVRFHNLGNAKWYEHIWNFNKHASERLWFMRFIKTKELQFFSKSFGSLWVNHLMFKLEQLRTKTIYESRVQCLWNWVESELNQPKKLKLLKKSRINGQIRWIVGWKT